MRENRSKLLEGFQGYILKLKRRFGTRNLQDVHFEAYCKWLTSLEEMQVAVGLHWALEDEHWAAFSSPPKF